MERVILQELCVVSHYDMLHDQCIIKGGGGPSNTTVIILTMMLKVILGLHVSILLNHLQAFVFQNHTKNVLRIVGSPTLIIKTKLQNYKTNNKKQKVCEGLLG